MERDKWLVGLDPLEGFEGEAFVGGDGKAEMFFAGVFDLVVGDAAEGLDEHHDGGDAGASDFGGVVERAGGEADRFAGDIDDGFAAEGDEVGVEGDGFDGPCVGPVDSAALFGGEAAAGFLSFAVHGGEDVGGEVALVEGALTAADDGRNDTGEGFEGAHGADGVGVTAGDGADFEGEASGGGERVVAIGHGG